MTENTFAVGIPNDLASDMSPKVQKLRKDAENVRMEFRKYVRENADCEAVNRAAPGYPANMTVPAIVKAEAELKTATKEALGAGKAVPDPDSILGPVKDRVAKYQATRKALEEMATEAESAYQKAVQADLPSIMKRLIKKADAAKADFIAAYEAAENARLRLERSVDLSVWTISGGIHSRPIGRGFEGPGDVEWWETENGRLTYECAERLGLIRYDLVSLEGFVSDAPEEEKTPWTTKHENSELNGNRTQVVWNPGNYGS